MATITKTTTPKKQDKQPGIEAEMNPAPEYNKDTYKAAGKLNFKVALITGGDSGIGRALSVHFAEEGADIAIVYLNEDEDANETKNLVEAAGHKCLLIKGDVKDSDFCKKAVKQTVKEFGKLNVLVNNAGMQFPQKDAKNITDEQLDITFRTNIFAYFYFAEAALEYLKAGDCIINTTSVTAYRSSPALIDNSSTKGAITTFTQTQTTNQTEKKKQEKTKTPGPKRTPLI